MKEEPRPVAAPVYKLGKEEKKLNYQMKCLKESLTDKHVVPPGQLFEKVWTLENSGDSPWPETTLFALDGDKTFDVTITNVGAVAPKEQIDVKATVKAPTKPGNCVGFFRLAYDKTNKFGQRLWLDFVVKELEESALKVEPPGSPEKPKEGKKEEKKEEKKVIEEVEVTKAAALAAKVQQLGAPKEYEANLLKLLEMNADYPADVLLDILRNNQNNLQAAAEFLFSQSHVK